jgi:hypothetical protein
VLHPCEQALVIPSAGIESWLVNPTGQISWNMSSGMTGCNYWTVPPSGAYTERASVSLTLLPESKLQSQ